MNFDVLGGFLIGSAVAGIVIGHLRYQSGVRDERQRIVAHLKRVQQQGER
jgi:hypothetical protein